VVAESVYKGYTVGGAYAINDMVSVAAGLRFVDAFKDVDATINPGAIQKLEFTDTADGWGGFLGVNYTPREDLNFGFRYETATELDFKTDLKRDDLGVAPLIGKTDGSKAREDLPGLIGLGAAYTINPKIKLDLSLTYYLEKSAKFEEDRLKDAGNSWDLALAGEYTFNPQLRASAGYMYTKTGIDADDMSPENPELGANTLCAGMAWEPMDKMTLNFAILNSFYNSDKTSTGIKYEKNVFGVGFGIEYKFK
jgi:long-chain fatty acid transport protein